MLSNVIYVQYLKLSFLHEIQPDIDDNLLKI